MIFQPCSNDLFFKSKNTADPRLGNLVGTGLKSTDSSVRTYSIAGYPDDEGVSINGGRPGAAAGPDRIRKYFYKMTPSAWSSETPNIFDEGNLHIEGPLAERHENLKNTIAENLQKENLTWIGLGGGHDYGYPDGAGFLLSQKQSKLRPLVINFDAHLDVRPDDKGLSSGTPFYRLLNDKNLPTFDFVEIGLQSQCNSAAHLKWLTDRGGHILGFDELNASGNFVETALSRLAPLLLQPRPTFLSVDIDAFSSAYAPGCSQSWATGLIPNDFMSLLKILKNRLQVRVLGIYEVAPSLDTDDRTSKLAAQIIHSFIY
jgi:formiminoglutamase